MILLDLSFALSFADIIALPVALVAIYIFAINYKLRKIKANPAYAYFMWGVNAKIIGAIALGLVYNFYYKGGDTLNYYQTASTLANLFYKDPLAYFKILTGEHNTELFSLFDYSTDWPFFWNDEYSFFVSRMVSPLFIITGNSFLACSIIVGIISLSGTWKLYLVFCEQFPSLKRNLAIAILFMPSVVFWGSGILKDTITLASVGWYTFGMYSLMVKNKNHVRSVLAIAISGFVILSIKPYIFFALLPGSMIWIATDKISKIKNKVFKFIAAPVLIVLGVGGGIYALVQFSQSLGVYSLETVFDRAVIVHDDLKRDFYRGNSFDIGSYDATLTGILTKAPLGIEATLFRPHIWEVRNPVMFLSSLENTALIVLTIFLLIRFKVIGFFRYITKHPLLLFAFLFSIFFAFAVGISISNFGALVRLKIPCIPFYVASLFILKHYYDRDKKSTKNL